MPEQAAHSVVMVEPHEFGYNPETAQSNIFQQQSSDKDISKKALLEFHGAVKIIDQRGIKIKTFKDTPDPSTPDAIFPNNWFFTTPEGKIVICPMASAIRRNERRNDIIQWLQDDFDTVEIIDITNHENIDQYLEGTGSIVFNYLNKKAFATPSSRTNEELFKHLCQELNYKAVPFMTRDDNGSPIYHTNVMMSIGTGYAIVCLDAVHPADHDDILENMIDDGLKVISISYKQMQLMTGNCLEVQADDENVLILSDNALKNLLPGQINAITKFVDVLPVNIPTIEKVAGGGIRCMMAGNHLPTKP